jgi:hypothetical protein
VEEFAVGVVEASWASTLAKVAAKAAARGAAAWEA